MEEVKVGLLVVTMVEPLQLDSELQLTEVMVVQTMAVLVVMVNNIQTSLNLVNK